MGRQKSISSKGFFFFFFDAVEFLTKQIKTIINFTASIV